jgi:hypothetical protein
VFASALSGGHFVSKSSLLILLSEVTAVRAAVQEGIALIYTSIARCSAKCFCNDEIIFYWKIGS